MSNITYTFIIPHKNCPDLLCRCLKSIPKREDIQIIIVDDNSDIGKSPNIPQENVEVVRLKKSQSNGAGHARNVGLEKVRGRWVLFVDADDYYYPNALDVLDKYKDSSNDVVFFNFDICNSSALRDVERIKWERVHQLISQHDENYVKYRFHVPWDKMVSRQFLLKHNIRFEEVTIGNDILYSLLIGYYAKTFEIESTAIYNYYINPHSLSFGYRNLNRLMCMIEGWFKVNKFNDFIGHREWNTSISKEIAYLVIQNKKRSLFIIVNFLMKYPYFLYVSKRYVDIIRNRHD